MTMSKSIIVCFIVLAALAIHAAPQTGRNLLLNSTLRALKDKCIRGIQSTFLEVKLQWQETVAANPSAANYEALHNVTWDGFVGFNRFVGKVHKALLINTIQTHEILPGVPVACEPKVMVGVTLLTEQMMKPMRKSIIRV